MKIFRDHRKPVIAVAAAAFLTAMLPMPAAHAALVSTDRVVTTESQEARAKINAFLSRDDVRQQMEALGVSPDQAKERVAALSDEEVAQIEGKLDSMPAGQDFFGAVLGVALVVFVVLLITDLLGYTNAFSFTNKGSANPNN